MFFKKKPLSQLSAEGERVIHHFVFLEVPTEIVWPEIMRWGLAEWWPKRTAIKVVPAIKDEVHLGSKFKYKILKMLAPSWDAEVSKFVPENLIERKFLNGPLNGYEAVKVEWRYNGTRIDYELHYRVRGLFHKIFWPFLGEKIYNNSAKQIMEALKNFVSEKYRKQQNN